MTRIKAMLRAGIAASQNGNGHANSTCFRCFDGNLGSGKPAEPLWKVFSLAFVKLWMHHSPVPTLHELVVKWLCRMKIRLLLIC